MFIYCHVVCVWLQLGFELEIGFTDYLYTYDSELQAVAAPPLISTIHKSSQHPLYFSSHPCLHQPSLATVSNSGDLQLHALKSSLNAGSLQTPRGIWGSHSGGYEDFYLLGSNTNITYFTRKKKRIMRSPCCVSVQPPYFFVFYSICAVSKESRRTVLMYYLHLYIN
jgi:hypothetical protein